MKHFTFPFILTLLLTFSITQAQPTITGQQALVFIGESAPVQFANGNFQPGPAGVNVTWDFSGLQDDSLSFSWTGLDPAQTPFVDSFPTASIAYRAPIDGNSDNWIYYELPFGSNVLDLLGSAAVLSDSSGQDTVFYILTPNPKRVQVFPFTYQNNSSDFFMGRNVISFNGTTIVQQRTGNLDRTGDAWGTLTTPAGTFQNVLRIKTTESITDTYMGFPTTQTITRYSWLSSDEKYLLLHMDSIAVQPQGGPAQVTTQIFYRNGAPVLGRTDALATGNGLVAVSPNPATGRTVRLSFRNAAPVTGTVSLTDARGRRLAFTRTLRLPAGRPVADVDLPELPAGLYFIRVSGDGFHWTQKLILQ